MGHHIANYLARRALQWTALSFVVLFTGIVSILALEASAQTAPSGQVAVWTYPDGYFMVHPTDDSLVCLVAPGHPTRGTEIHCAPLSALTDTI